MSLAVKQYGGLAKLDSIIDGYETLNYELTANIFYFHLKYLKAWWSDGISTFSTLWANSDKLIIYFLYFSENSIWNFTQIVS